MHLKQDFFMFCDFFDYFWQDFGRLSLWVQICKKKILIWLRPIVIDQEFDWEWLTWDYAGVFVEWFFQSYLTRK